MKFGPVPLDEAKGKILAHNVSGPDGRRLLRKGLLVDDGTMATLREMGLEEVYVAEPEPDDVHEDEAAQRAANVLAGEGVDAGTAHVGRVNLTARETGVLHVRVQGLDQVNRIDGLTVATLRAHTLVREGDRVATVKVIPYAVPRGAVERAEAFASDGAIVSVRTVVPARVGIVLSGSRGAWESLREGLGRAIRERVERLGCTTGEIGLTTDDERLLAEELVRQVAAGAELLVVAGETAIMDIDDVIPRAIRQARGEVEHLGLAMDPGQLLLLAYLGNIPVIGAPGCVRGTAPDGFDAVLPRLLSGERLAASDLEALGHGGLLSNPRAE